MRAHLISAATAVLALSIASGAVAHDRHHHHRHYHYRYHHRDYAYAAAAYGEPASADVVGGPDVITSRPVPDTVGNRMRYGGPMSFGGRMTEPAGD